jgi:hypothetical protein
MITRMEEPHDPMDGFDLRALRGMLDRFEGALREARAASRAAEGLEEPAEVQREEIEMPRSSGGRITHKRVGDDPQHTRIVEGAYGTSVGYISEETGRWGFLLVTPDGRGAVAYADTRVEAMRQVCDELGVSRRTVIGSDET